MSVSLAAADAGGFRVGSPVSLFQTRAAPTSAIARQQYVVAADGQRFLINTVERNGHRADYAHLELEAGDNQQE